MKNKNTNNKNIQSNRAKEGGEERRKARQGQNMVSFVIGVTLMLNVISESTLESHTQGKYQRQCVSVVHLYSVSLRTDSDASAYMKVWMEDGFKKESPRPVIKTTLKRQNQSPS